MKTLKTTLLLSFVCLFLNLPGQNTPQNPPELTEAQKAALREIPELQIDKSKLLKKSALPSSVDNAQNIFFPAIVNQQDWSCGQKSGVEYVFTYEMNCARRANGMNPENQYASHFTWNYLNRSSFEIGASYFDSWRIIKEFGHPSKATFDPGNNNTLWMNGYENYYAAMQNRITSMHSIRVDTEEGLLKLKNWLYNHAGESIYGGVANYYGSSEYYNSFLPEESPHAGSLVITKMYDIATHALTIVGYDDNICYDFNEDGMYTNDVDINSDGEVNMRDWEIGGFIVANSYSADWANEGFVYVMFKLAAEPPEVGGFWNNTVNLVKVKENYAPKLTLKAEVKYTSRHRLKIMAGYATDTNATAPEFVKEFPILNYQGGAQYMRGYNTEENKKLEFGLDITQFYNQLPENEYVKFFLIVNENDSQEFAEGEILRFSIIDYTNGEEETISNEHFPVPLSHGDNQATLIKRMHTTNALKITTWNIPITHPNEPFEEQMRTSGGTPPFTWNVYTDNYEVEVVKDKFDRATPNIMNFEAEMNSKIKIDLDFTFPYYGKAYNAIYVTTNGSILLDKNLFLYPYTFFKDYILANRKGIVVFGANDQEAGYYNRVYTQTYPGEAIQVFWDLGQHYMTAASFQYRAKLYKDGTIEFNFNDFDSQGLPWVSGISNGDQVNYVVSPLENKRYLEDSTIIRFTPPEQFLPELSIDEDGLISGIAPDDTRETKFNVKVTDFTGAYAVKELSYLTWPNSIHEAGKASNLRIYPNPANKEIQVSLKDKIDATQVLIYNALGQEMMNASIANTSSSFIFQLDVSIFKPGIYIVKIVGKKGSIENKFVKK